MSNQTQQPTRKRVVHQLDTPFSTVSWPEISSEDQDTILELLCSLLSPIGQHRQAYKKRSKGKKATKREAETVKRPDDSTEKPPVPPNPEINDSLDIGLNSITRNLEALASDGSKENPIDPSRMYSMVFVARGNQAASFNCQFPQMVGVASRNLPPENKIRLVGFSKPCSERLSACLGVPRVSSIAILKDAPGAGALQDFVQKAVKPVEVNWIEEARSAGHLATKIKAVETTVGPKRAKAEL